MVGEVEVEFVVDVDACVWLVVCWVVVLVGLFCCMSCVRCLRVSFISLNSCSFFSFSSCSSCFFLFASSLLSKIPITLIAVCSIIPSSCLHSSISIMLSMNFVLSACE